ncbi:unnamed protein product [Eruca vesicaria subsp. sativa]|uniref:Uncharacterized protein n=1 Tax=Eruca vesicaria subsp. sativa TaxID=29727 RepID=A0ABC8JHA4_ERUVS|nr:unnamed protein product [Eruca vesicaria subsp. sativa]
MAETESPEINCVYVETNLDTRLAIPVHNNETISDFKEKLCKEHFQCFPKLGEISISAVKVKRQNTLGLLVDFHLPDSMYLSMAFEGVSDSCWFLSVDATVSVVDKCELMDDADEKNKAIANGSLVLGALVAEKMAKKRKLRSSDGGKSGTKHELVEKNKEIATDSLLLDTKNQTPEEDLETHVVEKPRKKRKVKGLDGETSVKKPLVDVSQSAAAATTVSRFDGDGSHELCGNVVSESSPREKLDDMLTETTGGKEIEMGEKPVEDLGGDKTENNDLVSQPANLVDTNSGLTTRPDTEKKKRRKKKSEDDINQSSATVTVGEIGLPENVDRVDATPESLPISRDNPLAEASQRENDMAVDDVARDKAETDNLEGQTEIHLDCNNVEEDINQSSAAAAAIIASGDIVNQINEVSANVDHVDAAPESLLISRRENLDNHFAEASQKDTEMVEKSVEDEGRDKIETDNIASNPENLLDTNSVLTTKPDTEKKKKRKKRSKDDINQSSASAAITTSIDIVNEINEVPANVDPVDATHASLPMSVGTVAESSQKGNEMVEKIDDDVGSGKAIPSDAENIKRNEMVEKIDDDGAKSVKTTKKKKSKRVKTPAKEDTMVASGAENVEAIEAVDGEGTDNVIRNILDSLQEKNETEGNLDTTGKKSSKKLKKKHSSKVVESQVLAVEVNTTALEQTPLINNPKDTDTLFTPVKKDAESDASLLKKSPEIAEDKSLSKKIPIEKIDMGDNFGCSPNQEKQDQVAGGAKSKKQKKRLDLHPSGSIAGSVSSAKPKEKKSRGQQPASSGASHLQSVVKNGRSGTVKTTVSSKKQDVKKSSKPVAVDKRKTNFFENAEKSDSSEDEYKKTSNVSTKTPSDYSSDNDSDVTSMSRKQQGNNLTGGTNKFEGSLQDLLRRSSSYKKALIRAQSQPDIDDDSPVDCVPDSQGL